MTSIIKKRDLFSEQWIWFSQMLYAQYRHLRGLQNQRTNSPYFTGNNRNKNSECNWMFNTETMKEDISINNHSHLWHWRNRHYFTVMKTEFWNLGLVQSLLLSEQWRLICSQLFKDCVILPPVPQTLEPVSV